MATAGVLRSPRRDAVVELHVRWTWDHGVCEQIVARRRHFGFGLLAAVANTLPLAKVPVRGRLDDRVELVGDSRCRRSQRVDLHRAARERGGAVLLMLSDAEVEARPPKSNGSVPPLMTRLPTVGLPKSVDRARHTGRSRPARRSGRSSAGLPAIPPYDPACRPGRGCYRLEWSREARVPAENVKKRQWCGGEGAASVSADALVDRCRAGDRAAERVFAALDRNERPVPSAAVPEPARLASASL